MSQEVNLFQKAVKNDYRFPSAKGFVNTIDLYKLKLDELDETAKALNKEYKESGEESFVKKSTAKNQSLKDRLDVVVAVINDKLAEKEARENAVAKREAENKLLDLIAKKKEEALGGKSVEELEAELAALQGK